MSFIIFFFLHFRCRFVVKHPSRCLEGANPPACKSAKSGECTVASFLSSVSHRMGYFTSGCWPPVRVGVHRRCCCDPSFRGRFEGSWCWLDTRLAQKVSPWQSLTDGALTRLGWEKVLRIFMFIKDTHSSSMSQDHFPAEAPGASPGCSPPLNVPVRAGNALLGTACLLPVCPLPCETGTCCFPWWAPLVLQHLAFAFPALQCCEGCRTGVCPCLAKPRCLGYTGGPCLGPLLKPGGF